MCAAALAFVDWPRAAPGVRVDYVLPGGGWGVVCVRVRRWRKGLCAARHLAQPRTHRWMLNEPQVEASAIGTWVPVWPWPHTQDVHRLSSINYTARRQRNTRIDTFRLSKPKRVAASFCVILYTTPICDSAGRSPYITTYILYYYL